MFRGLCCVGDAMKKLPGRRQVLKGAAAACAALLLPGKEEVADSALRVAGEDVEIQIAPVSRHTVRLTVVPVKRDRKSTRLNSSHTVISYAVFCLKKKILDILRRSAME